MPKEKNRYLAELRQARDTLDAQVQAMLGDKATLEAAIVSHIATNGGWVCDEADDWIADLTGYCGPVLTSFASSRSELTDAIGGQSGEELVPEGDWRGNSYSRTDPYSFSPW